MEGILEIGTAGSVGFGLIEKEADMGFFENHFKRDADGQISVQGSCPRISHCTCNCNDCSFMSG